MGRSSFRFWGSIGCPNLHRTQSSRQDFHLGSDVLHNRKAKYGGMTVSEAQRLKDLEQEDNRLKRLLAESMLDNAALRIPLP